MQLILTSDNRNTHLVVNYNETSLQRIKNSATYPRIEINMTNFKRKDKKNSLRAGAISDLYRKKGNTGN